MQLLGALAVFIPAVLGALKTYKNASDSSKRLEALEAWQKSQDEKLASIKEDTARGFKEQGQHRAKLDMSLAILEDRVRDTKHRVDAIPSRSEYNYQRPPTMELTPLPVVAPHVEPVIDPFPDLDDEFKPKRKKR